jgi:hypothetical protein
VKQLVFAKEFVDMADGRRPIDALGLDDLFIPAGY